MTKSLLAIDQGTTGTTALVVGLDGETLGRHTVEFPQHFPKPGWVEHNPRDIWRSVEAAVRGALAAARLEPARLAAIGLTNQRETTVVWDRASRDAIANAIVWQCRRTADECERLRADGLEPLVRRRTGLVLDSYFSATKIAWLLDTVPGARARAERGELAFGTIDSWLVSQLTAGEVHATDVTNAARTSLMNLETGHWDEELCAAFRVPGAVLPRIVGNAEIVGSTRGLPFLPDGLPIAGMAGDQQAALFGQGCFAEGDAKTTYGTGAFALMNVGPRPIASTEGLITTVAWRLAGEPMTYALEGSAFIAGAAVQWLRDGLGLVRSAPEVETLARSVSSSEGVTFVPALAGLGAPYWDPDARGTITGLTRGSTAAHLARATLEGIAFQVNDLLAAMQRDARREIRRLRVDGGASANDLLLELQADFSGLPIDRPVELESTARGAAMLAGLGCGLVAKAQLASLAKVARSFVPSMEVEVRASHLSRWREAVSRARMKA